MTSNDALADELEAVNSIYDVDTLTVTHDDATSTATVLTLPDLPFSFSLTFPAEYPDVPPQITGTQSTGPNTKKGDGEAALGVLRDVLGAVYMPGQVCLFDMIEEVRPLLQRADSDAEQTLDSQDSQSGNQTGPVNKTATTSETRHSAILTDLSNLHVRSLASQSTAAPESMSEPNWTISDPLMVNKSTFVARSLPVTTLTATKSAITHLLSTNRKVAVATHNITAWRIRSARADGPEVVVQDCDDDGETAAGGRLLHLMQLMDVWNCVVVVSRWYGGVKLGPDRFRCINVVAREALVKGGFVREEEKDGGGKGKRGKKGG